MVGDFSSMLNVFLLFLNSFLRFLFFLAWLIPQLLQKNLKLMHPFIHLCLSICSFCLQFTFHILVYPLMGSIILGTPHTTTIRLYAQPNPPCGQLAQPKQCLSTCKRRAIITSY